MDIQKIKDEIKELVNKGTYLIRALVATDEQHIHLLKEMEIDIESLPYLVEYEKWYTEALLYIKQFIPDRLNDFILLYKNDNRKTLDSSTYSISDALQGISVRRGLNVLAKPMTAFKKMEQQIEILSSISKIIDLKILTYESDIRVDIFDSEINSATTLLQKGFLRAAGAICGVLIEKHLNQVCTTHKLSITKKDPSINDFNEILKNNNIIDTPTWRHVQLMADIRNVCCHDKKLEPTKEQAQDLINGTKKIISTIF